MLASISGPYNEMVVLPVGDGDVLGLEQEAKNRQETINAMKQIKDLIKAPLKSIGCLTLYSVLVRINYSKKCLNHPFDRNLPDSRGTKLAGLKSSRIKPVLVMGMYR